jgi:hypothetical protein
MTLFRPWLGIPSRRRIPSRANYRRRRGAQVCRALEHYEQHRHRLIVTLPAAAQSALLQLRQ